MEPLLTHREIRGFASELGLGGVVDGVIDALMPAYRLEPSRDGAHRIGGEPDMVAGETWPLNDRGVELTFIAQFDISHIPGLPGAPPEVELWGSKPAFVRLFADLYDHPFEMSALTALVAEPSARRTRAAAPTRPPSAEDTDDDLIIAALREETVSAEPCWCLDLAHPAIDEAAKIDHGRMIENAPLLELSHRLHAGRSLHRGWHVLSQLLGSAMPVQDDPRYSGITAHSDGSLQDLDAWALLLQLDDSFASYGDGGGLFIVIPRADLAAGRYDRAVTVSDCL